MAGVFDGLKVLDLSWGIAGPMTTMLLADHGADVTKIERPQGDPFEAQPGYRVWQRGKRSAVFDLKSADDKALFLNLVRSADVLVESFSPGTTTRLNVDYETLSEINPRLIYVSITGYGPDTEASDRPAYDSLVAARVGLQWVQRSHDGGHLHWNNEDPGFPLNDMETPAGAVDGPDRDGPLFTASPWPSMGAAYLAMTGAVAALVARENTGRGQLVETSLAQGALTAGTGMLQRAEHPDAQLFWTWVFDRRSPMGFFECADGRWVEHWVPNPKFVLGSSQGDKLEPAGSRPSNDPDRMMTGPEDLIVYWHYLPEMRNAFKRFTAQEWVEAARVAGVCLQPVHSPAEALRDEHMLADGCVAVVEDSELGPLSMLGSLIRLDRSPGKPTRGAPRYGEHTAEVKADAAKKVTNSGLKPTAPTGSGKAPLDGVLVVDLGLAIAGPFATQLLSDLGATVIKINTLWDSYWHSNHISFTANRGKQSLSVNLKDPRGLDAVRRIINKADMVQHNMRYDAAVRLGLDYESVKVANPNVIYCHSRGFDHGYRAAQPGNDQTGASLTGVAWLDGGMDQGGKPLWSTTSMGDTGNGYLAAIGMLQAYYDRLRTGRGQFVDTSILYACLLTASNTYLRQDGAEAERDSVDGMLFGFNALHGLYETAEGWLSIAVLNEDHWTGLRSALPSGALSLTEFPDPTTPASADRVLREDLERILATNTAERWFGILDQHGVPVEISDINAIRATFQNPDYLARQWMTSYPHPHVGRVDQVGIGIDFSDTPGVIQGPPLTSGGNSREILETIGGFKPSEVDMLIESGVVINAQNVAAPV